MPRPVVEEGVVPKRFARSSALSALRSVAALASGWAWGSWASAEPFASVEEAGGGWTMAPKRSARERRLRSSSSMLLVGRFMENVTAAARVASLVASEEGSVGLVVESVVVTAVEGVGSFLAVEAAAAAAAAVAGGGLEDAASLEDCCGFGGSGACFIGAGAEEVEARDEL